MTKRCLIGIPPLVDVERESYWMLPGYMDGIRLAKGLPVMFPLTTNESEINQLVDAVDGILLPGGPDVDPALYGEQPIPAASESLPNRDTMELTLLHQALRQHKPVLGICKGIQLVNVAFGGTLYQDLPSQRPTHVNHCMTPPYDRTVHTVDIVEGTPLAQTLGAGSLAVNSYHHQAICNLAPCLEAMAYSEDGLVEAVRKPDETFLWAVQWHPELMYRTDEASRQLFRAFVQACRA